VFCGFYGTLQISHDDIIGMSLNSIKAVITSDMLASVRDLDLIRLKKMFFIT